MIRVKIRYVLIAVGLFLLAILYNEYITSYLFCIVLAFPVLMWIIMEFVKRHVDICLKAPVTAVRKNSPFTIELLLKNHTIMPIVRMQIVIYYQNEYTKQVQKEVVYASLDALSEEKIEVEIISAYCGNVLFSLGTVKLYDLIGLFRFRKKEVTHRRICVLPDACAVEGFLIRPNFNVMVESEQYSKQIPGDDPSELFGIREYRYGDRMNRIHWKLTKKEDKMMIKEFGLPLNGSILILVEIDTCLSQEEMLKIMDAVTECIFCLSLSLIEQEISHEIAWYDKKTKAIRKSKITKEEELYEMASLLFKAEGTDEIATSLRHYAAEYEKEQYTNIYYIAGRITEETVQEFVKMAKNAVCHVVKIGAVSEALQEFVECLPIHFIKVSEEDPVHDMLTMVQEEEGRRL